MHEAGVASFPVLLLAEVKQLTGHSPVACFEARLLVSSETRTEVLSLHCSVTEQCSAEASIELT